MSIRTVVFALAALLGSAGTVLACDHDRFDGKGVTKATVDVIAWHDDNTWQFQVSPKGKLEAIGYKIVEGPRGKRLVLSYRFKDVSYYSRFAGKTLHKFYRYTALELPLPEAGAKLYFSGTARKEHDHLVLTREPLKDNKYEGKKYQEMALDPAPEYEEVMDCREDAVPRLPASTQIIR